jgi:hypothetical protein
MPVISSGQQPHNAPPGEHREADGNGAASTTPAGPPLSPLDGRAAGSPVTGSSNGVPLQLEIPPLNLDFLKWQQLGTPRPPGADGKVTKRPAEVRAAG